MATRSRAPTPSASSATTTPPVQVHHEWTDFSNGVVTLDGTADVTWNLNDKTRRVQHESHWTQLKSGRTGTGTR